MTRIHGFTSGQARVLFALVLCGFTTNNLEAQGALIPPGAPAATMRTLDQIYARLDARNPITNASSAVTITVPGSYYLTTNLTVSSGTAITIATNCVTLDLNGYTIKSTAASAAGDAIFINSGLRNLTIEHGFIESGVTNNGNGVYAGPGFAEGIYQFGTVPVNTRISGVSVAGCLNRGIYVSFSYSTVVEDCTVQTMGGIGIYASTINRCVALDCGGTAIYGNQVSDSRGDCTGAGTGVESQTAQNCKGSSSSGNGLFATSALNCYGFSTSGTGIYTDTAQNCSGDSNSGYGILANVTANNCYGVSSSGTGLYAYNASYCTGNRSGGTAIQATIATGCIAYYGTNIITYKYNMP